MPISPFYKPITQIRQEVGNEAANQGFGLGLDPSMDGGLPPPGPQYNLGVSSPPPAMVPTGSDQMQAPIDPNDAGMAQDTPPEPPLDDNAILQKYMRQKFPDQFAQGQAQADANRVTRADLDQAQSNAGLDAITNAFSKAAAAAGSVGGAASKSNYADIAKESQQADHQALKERMDLTNQGEDLQQSAIKGMTAADTQNYQNSLRPLELQAKQQGLDQGAANLEKTNLGLQGAQMDFRSKESLSDPDSPQSKALRAIAKGYGMKVTDDMTGAQLSDLIPIAEKAFTASENRNSRMDVASLRQETMKQNSEDRQAALADKKQAKDSTELDKRFTAVKQAVDATRGRQGQFGVQRVILDNTDKLTQLARNPDGTAANLTTTQLQELAIAANKMLGGSDAAGQIEHLLPKNAQMSETALKDWLTSEPHGANQKAYIDLTLHTLDRERALAQAKIKQATIAKIQAYNDLEQKDPVKFADMLQKLDITPDEYKNGVDINSEIAKAAHGPGANTTSKGRTLYTPGMKVGG